MEVNDKTIKYYILESVIDNCELACLSYELYIDSLMNEFPLRTLNYRMMNTYHLYNFIIYSANVSKFYTLGNQKSVISQFRKSFLNQEIPLPKDSQIHNREIRNAIEHFHDRIDSFFYGLINNTNYDLDITNINTKKIVKKDNKIIYIEIFFDKLTIIITDLYNELSNIKDKAFSLIGDYLDLDFIMQKRNEQAKKYGFPEVRIYTDDNGNKTYSV